MSEFQGCDKCKHVNKRPHEEPCVNCTHCAEEHFAPMTNADRIRNMTDEELADILSDTCSCAKIMFGSSGCTKASRISCKECALQWLQAEAKEGNSNENT